MARRTKKTEVAVVDQVIEDQVTENEDLDEVNEILANAEDDLPLQDVVKAVKRRKASTKDRDDSGKVIRKGRNLSGNQPFRGKPYFFDLDVKKTPDYDKAFNSAPMQVRLILKYMEEQGITTEDDAMRGGEICGGAINSGTLQSKIDPPVLFAYYRRVMERLGLRLAIEE